MNDQQDQQSQQRTHGQPERRGRRAPEWATFIGSCLILALVAVLVMSQLVGPHAPAAPRAVTTGEVRAVNGQQHVDVEVSNTGDETAANVQVSVEFVVDGETTEADQIVDFLAGGEKVTLVFLFDEAPFEGQLKVAVTGYTDP